MSFSPLDQEIRDLIGTHGRIPFAQFMQVCLYSAQGGFYAGRGQRISSHFGTSAMSHPLFGALIARQLEQMWHLLGEPPVFHVIEAGSGDGALARSIVHACRRAAPRLAQALYYVAADYAPRWLHSSDHAIEWGGSGAGMDASGADTHSSIRRVQAEGVGAFRHVVGCILSNELIDNFPVHRFVIRGGRVKEIFVTLIDGKLAEIVDEPSSGRIAQRLADLGLSLSEGYRGEVNLGLEDWTVQIARALDRGFVLTIDYGELANGLYGPQNSEGTLVCYRRHAASRNALEHLGQQDITCHVDFTSLMRLGDRHGLATVGYATQRQFLTDLGFFSLIDAFDSPSLSSARRALNRMAMTTLVDPEEYGDFKVLVQAKGQGADMDLLGFASQRP